MLLSLKYHWSWISGKAKHQLPRQRTVGNALACLRVIEYSVLCIAFASTIWYDQVDHAYGLSSTHVDVSLISLNHLEQQEELKYVVESR
jgi:hypothetical protein